MTLIKLTAPDGKSAWIVMETIEMLRPPRVAQGEPEYNHVRSVLHFTSGHEVAFRETVEEVLALLSGNPRRPVEM